MTRAEKASAIAELKDKFSNSQFFYLTDSSSLTVEEVNALRGLCFEKGVEMKVVKNTLAQKALEQVGAEGQYNELMESLKGPTTIMFTDTSNVPAKIIKQFREDHDKPILKAAYIDTDVYVGDEQISALVALKSKDELLGEIVAILQSPIKNVVGSLKSGGSTLAGLLKALEERAPAE